jgi:hypothetical protein
MNMKKILFLLMTVFTLNTFAQQVVNGVTLPSKFKGTKGELTLNGAGIRKKAMFKVYVLGLYIDQKSKDAKAIIKNNEEVIVRLQITSSVVNSENMSEAIREGFDKSLNGNSSALKSKIDAFINAFSNESIKVGDVFVLDYVPGVGVKTSKNSKHVTTVEGEDFKKALLGIWLGENPIDANLKKTLLGN